MMLFWSATATRLFVRCLIDLSISKTYPGKTHDKKVADSEKISYPEHIALHKDTGFQGYEPNRQSE